MEQNKDIRITKTSKETIYSIGNFDKFRIVEVAENQFVIERLFKSRVKKGILWWKKENVYYQWKRINKYGNSEYVSLYVPKINNLDSFITYKSKEKAIKWIEDYVKYPIYH